MNKLHIIVIFICFVMSILFSITIPTQILNDLIEKIVFNAISIILGISFALISIYVNQFTSLQQDMKRLIKIEHDVKNKEGLTKGLENLQSTSKERRDNVMFACIAYAVIIVLILAKFVDIPMMHWFISEKVITKAQFLNIVILTSSFAIIYTVYDSLKAMFGIFKYLEYINDLISNQIEKRIIKQ